MKIELRRTDGTVIWSGEAESLCKAIEQNKGHLYGANLYGANLSGAKLSGADLSGANLSWADLSWADLYRADLSGANLSWADLYGANLSGADLYRANLYGANLYGANLSGATGISLVRTSPLAMLLDQPGPIRAYKLVNEKSEGPFNGGVKYEIGQSYEEPGADTNPSEQCAKGLNVASLDWCMKEWRTGYRILLVEFTAADIAAIPIGTDGKFRLKRLTVVGEKDLTALGLVAVPKGET